jgi:hypothetical protein
MTEAELEMGRLRARIWRLEQERAQWERYADHLARQVKLMQEPPGEWFPDPETSSIARWWLAGAD